MTEAEAEAVGGSSLQVPERLQEIFGIASGLGSDARRPSPKRQIVRDPGLKILGRGRLAHASVSIHRRAMQGSHEQRGRQEGRLGKRHARGAMPLQVLDLQGPLRAQANRGRASRVNEDELPPTP